MKLKTHPHRSDILSITREELHELLAGKELSVSAMYVRMEEEPKPDRIEECTLHMNLGWRYGKPPEELKHAHCYVEVGEFKLAFDGKTNKLKSAEII